MGGHFAFLWRVTVYYRTEKGRFEHKLLIDNLSELGARIEPLLIPAIDRIEIVQDVAALNGDPIELTSAQVAALEKNYGQAEF